MMSKILSIGTGEAIPDDADYWYYDEPGDGDCVVMYTYYSSLEARTCDNDKGFPYICEIH